MELRRNWRRFALAVGVLLALAAAGRFAISFVTEPGFIAKAISQATGRGVEMGAVEVRTGFWIDVQIEDLRVYRAQVPEGPVLVRVDRAVASLSWLELLLGRVVPDAWVLDAPEVSLSAADLEGEGSFSAPPLADLEIRSGRLTYTEEAGSVAEISGLELAISKRTLLRGFHGTARGALSRAGISLGDFDLTLLGSPDDLTIEAQLSGLGVPAILAAFAPDAAFVDDADGSGPRGSLSTRATLDYTPDRTQARVDVRVHDLSIPIVDFRAPVALPTGQVGLSVTWQGDVLTVELDPGARLEEIRFGGQVVVDTAGAGRVRAKLAFEDFAPGPSAKGRLTPTSLMGLRYPTWRQLDEMVEAGVFRELTVAFDTPLSDFATAFDARVPRPRAAFSARTRLEGATLRARPDYPPFENVSGTIDFGGDRLAVRDVRMERDGAALPEIDFALVGFHRFLALPKEQREMPDGAGVALEGLGPLFRSLAGDPNAPPPDPPTAIRLSAFDVHYPGFLFSIWNAEGEVVFPPGEVRSRDLVGEVAGGPADIDVVWSYRTGQVDATIAYREADFVAEEPPGSAWLSGDFEMVRANVGGFELEDIVGRMEAHGGELRLADVRGGIRGGLLRTHGSVDLTRPDGAPIAFDLTVDRADASVLTQLGAFAESKISGRIGLTGKIGGKLAPDVSFLESGSLDIELAFADGTLENMPNSLTVARVLSLRGISGLFGKPLPYTSIEGRVSVDEGQLRATDVRITGPELRILIGGDVDLRDEARKSDLVVALLFLQTLDEWIESVPVFGQMILGEDRNLLAVYLSMTGPFDDLTVRPMAPDTLRKASSFLGQLRDMIPPLRRRAEPSSPEKSRPGENGGDEGASAGKDL